jgi:hypothetical protein
MRLNRDRGIAIKWLTSLMLSRYWRWEIEASLIDFHVIARFNYAILLPDRVLSAWFALSIAKARIECSECWGNNPAQGCAGH